MPHMSYLHITYNLFFSTGNPCGWYPDMSAVLRIFRRKCFYNGILEESIFRTAQSIDDSHGVHTECFFLGTEKPCDRGIVEYSNICVYIYIKTVHGHHSIAQINYFFREAWSFWTPCQVGCTQDFETLKTFFYQFFPNFTGRRGPQFHRPPRHLGFFCHRLPPPRRDWLIVVPRKMPKSWVEVDSVFSRDREATGGSQVFPSNSRVQIKPKISKVLRVWKAKRWLEDDPLIFGPLL